ncbi:MAG: serine/threonine-protein phosphatase [Lachnospiraceae bacterium]|nr:serine/threonine-protein phosphatase [Lachnospiraceae bacterium]
MTEYALFSEKGLRSVNQDAVLAASRDDHALLVVADGMGGHSFGEVASAAIIKAVNDWWVTAYDKEPFPSLDEAILKCRKAILKVNDDLLGEYSDKGQIVGSTVVLLLLWEGEYAAISVGDSHIYRQTFFGLEAITEDDIWENMPEVRMSMSEEQIMQDPRYGKLTAAVGPSAELEPHIIRGKLKRRETFLLCSDGVYKFCPVKELARIMRSRGTVKERAEKIRRCAYDHATRDNYSAVLCAYKKTEKS